MGRQKIGYGERGVEARERGRGGKFAWRGEDRVGELRIYLLNGVEENPKKIAH